MVQIQVTIPQIPAASSVNLTDKIELDQAGISASATIQQVAAVTGPSVISALTFASVTALKSFVPNSALVGGNVYLSGYSAIGDGGEGYFRLTNSMPGPSNGGTIIWSNTSGYYFVRQFSGPIYPEWYGAKGDGTSDDVNALQAMVGEWRILSITRVGTLATLTVENSSSLLGFASTLTGTISGFNEAEYNVTTTLSVTGANTLTYTVSGTPASPATFISGNSGRLNINTNPISIALRETTYLVGSPWTIPSNCNIAVNGATLKLSPSVTISGTCGSVNNGVTVNVSPGWTDGVYQFRITDPIGVAYFAANVTVTGGIAVVGTPTFTNSTLAVVGHGDSTLDVTNNYGSALTLNWSYRLANTPPAVMWLRNVSNVFATGTIIIDANLVPEAQGLAISSGTSTALAQIDNIRFDHVIAKNTRIDPQLLFASASLTSGGGKGITGQFKLGSVKIDTLETVNCDIDMTAEAAESGDRQEYAFVIDSWYSYQNRRTALVLTGNNPTGESTSNPGSYDKAFYPGFQINSGLIRDPQAVNIVVPGVGSQPNYQVFGLLTATYATGYSIRGIKIAAQNRVTIARGFWAHGNLHISQGMMDVSPEAIVDWNPVPTNNPIPGGLCRGFDVQFDKFDVYDSTTPSTALFTGLTSQKPGKGSIKFSGAGYAATNIMTNIGTNVEYDVLNLEDGSRVYGNTNVSAAPVFTPAQLTEYKNISLPNYLPETGTVTPVFSTTSTPPTGVTYGVQNGTYIKIGPLVWFTLRITLTSKGTGGTGAVRISGLPYASHATFANTEPATLSLVTFSAGYSQFTGRVTTAASTVDLFENGSNVASQAVTWANCNNTSDFIISGVYST